MNPYSSIDPRDIQRDACGVGFICRLDSSPKHDIVRDGLKMLNRMDHRGGPGAEPLSNDGAGIMLDIPHELLFQEKFETKLPDKNTYAVAMVFLPKNIDKQNKILVTIKSTLKKYSLNYIGMRRVPVKVEFIGKTATKNLPDICQIIVTGNKDIDQQVFYCQKKLEEIIYNDWKYTRNDFYICSFSTKIIIYKGLIKSGLLDKFYPDLDDSLTKSRFSMVHQRFSTNTLPQWNLAQPFRVICHNGEINTLRGNINWMQARKPLMKPRTHQKEFSTISEIFLPQGSDSAIFDNVAEAVFRGGRGLEETISMMIPEPVEHNKQLNPELKSYYEYSSFLMEPWEGPAFIGFCDGNIIGAKLDRNGLRPAKYIRTSDGKIILASESGLLDIDDNLIVEKGRLGPGQMISVDLNNGIVFDDEIIKKRLSSKLPCTRWLKSSRLFLSDLKVTEENPFLENKIISTNSFLQYFGYTDEELKFIINPIFENGTDPVGSMGNDSPLAPLAKNHQNLFNFFKQLFAQVTNPPIDSIREKIVTSLRTFIGSSSNIFEDSDKQCQQISLSSPVLSNSDFNSILNLNNKSFHSEILDTTIESSERFESKLQNLVLKAKNSIDSGTNILIFSDRNWGEDRIAIPSLLIISTLHHELIQGGYRAKCSLIMDSYEPREVHHFAALLGYGCDGIYPRGIEKILSSIKTENRDKFEKNFKKAINSGLLKTMSKMGISSLQSYKGAQIFEAVGLSKELVDRYFLGTTTRVCGWKLKDLESYYKGFHNKVFFGNSRDLNQEGNYHWRKNGERKIHSPEMIATLQKSVILNSYGQFKKYCEKLDDQHSGNHLSLRGLLSINTKNSNKVPLSEVESSNEIVKRFATGAMSLGSISKEAHETIAIAMNRIGAKSNSGEGGEDSERNKLETNGDSKKSAVKQVASGRFGVTSYYLSNASDIQIKLAQGAKPGEGGQLPGFKVDKYIAKIRHSNEGVTLISPPPHHDIYSIEDLAQLIYDLKNSNPHARIGVKLVSSAGVGTIASGVAKAKSDVILISGSSGGTGASPISSIKHSGLPWELGLADAHKSLIQNNLRDRLTLQVDGGLRTPKDIAVAAMLGAEEWGVGTGALVTIGCIMMRKCHLNSCPVGIATQDPELREKFAGKPEHLIRYMLFLADGLREIMAELGIKKVDDLVGRSDFLYQNSFPNKLDLSSILDFKSHNNSSNCYKTKNQDHELEKTIDTRELIPLFKSSLDLLEPKFYYFGKMNNIDRSIGTNLSYEISKKYGEKGLLENSIQLKFTGTAGHSFMAFGAKGIQAIVDGEVNDYFAKGLSGATVAVKPTSGSIFIPEENIICGNVALFGATSGEVFLRGLVGERFAVRNSGANAVCEGLGDHGCEYMTGGTVLVLGNIGKNFGAGMSGGQAFVYNKESSWINNINFKMVNYEERLSDEDHKKIYNLLVKHFDLTESAKALQILDLFELEKQYFKKILPKSENSVFEIAKKSHLPNIGGKEIDFNESSMNKEVNNG